MRAKRARLRRMIRDRRRALSQLQRRHAADAVARNSAVIRLLGRHSRMAFYLANDGEIDPALLMERLHHAGKHCYLPVLDRHRDRALWFAPHSPGGPTVRNRFGIPEPLTPPGGRLRASQLDVVILPLVAFDEQGNRLGMGGGFYDRSLSFLGHRHRWRRPLLLGLGYQFQQIDTLATRSWDVPLDGIITERGLRWFGARQTE